MASLTANTAKHATLVASTVDDVTLSSYGRYVQIVHRGSATNPIYIGVGKAAADTTTPTTGGADNTLVVTAGAPLTVAWPYTSPGTTVCVKLISAGAEPYSVQVINDRLS